VYFIILQYQHQHQYQYPTLGSPRIAQWALPNVFLMRVCDAALWAPAAESRHCTLTARQPDEGQWPLHLFSHWCCRGPDDALHCLREFIDFLLQRPARELYCNVPEASRGLTTLGRQLRILGEDPVRSSTSGAGYTVLGQRRSELSASLVTSKYPSNIDVSEVGHDDESLTRSSLSIIKTLTDITLAL